MFIRFNTSKRTKNPIVQIIESYRDNGKVKQRIVASLGAASSADDLLKLEKLANDLIAKLKTERIRRQSLFPDDVDELKSESKKSLQFIDPRNLKHESTIFDGFDQVIAVLLRDFGFDNISLVSRRVKSFDGLTVLRLLLAQMWHKPSSKLRSYQDDHGFDGIKLQHSYRFMDHLIKQEKQVLKALFHAVYGGLNPQNVDCIFIDVTTLYYESVQQDELKEFGFSKDQKFHNVQMVLCLAVNSEGIPLMYKIFKGNTAEVNTLIPALEEIKNELGVDSATIVTDRGLASKVNIEAISACGFNWITAAKIKHLPENLKLNDISTFTPFKGGKFCEKAAAYKLVKHPKYPNTNLLVTYSPRRAKKDLNDRNKLIARLEAKLKPDGVSSKRTLISNSGYRQFTKFSEPGLWSLDQKAIDKAASWDGLHGIAFSDSLNLSPQEILSQYRNLWRIEEAFRVGKTYLEIRPMFHWTPSRIRSHILICYIGLFLERYLEFRLRAKATPLTPDRIRRALTYAHTIRLHDPKTDQKIEVPSRLTDDAKAIFKLLTLSKRTTKVN